MKNQFRVFPVETIEISGEADDDLERICFKRKRQGSKRCPALMRRARAGPVRSTEMAGNEKIQSDTVKDGYALVWVVAREDEQRDQKRVRLNLMSTSTALDREMKFDNGQTEWTFSEKDALGDGRERFRQTD